MKTPKTNAMRLLETMGIAYTCHTYSTADGAIDGPAVAAKTGRDPGTVFKTLATRGVGGGLCVFCLPVNQELNLKKAAAAAGEKRVEMLAVAQITAATGYVRGGVSPLGMKKAWPTFLEESALKQESILVSGGRIGLQIELAPADLLKAANATVFANE
ncbi:Cys-tRNA(Pro) deacylase [Ruminococcaceae bacterium OttesenSCG-928-O06]|nr:Cys-tRNA(Pro) deacylase [Ruminococcaceae bacterium OttesenSCG-928-O06]